MSKAEFEAWSFFVEKVTNAGWLFENLTAFSQDEIVYSSKIQAEYENRQAHLHLELYSQEKYILFSITKDNFRNGVAFHFYFGENLKKVLELILNNQNRLSLDDYTDFIKSISVVCEYVLLEVQGLPCLRISFDETFLNPQEIATTLEPPSMSINADIEQVLDNKLEEREDSSFEEELEKQLDDLDIVVDYATALTRFTNQHLRITLIIEEAVKIKPNPLKPLLHEDNLLHNSCEWIVQGKCDLCILMPTHDSKTRNPSRGVAYFDPLVKYPQREGTYPIDSSVKNSRHLRYADVDNIGGITDRGRLLEIFNPDKLSDSDLSRFLIQEIQRSVDCTSLVSGNIINSIRIQNLYEAINLCLNSMDISAPQILNLFQKIDDLDCFDRMLLSKQEQSKPFFDLAKAKLTNTIYQKLCSAIDRL
jgi:hypothetical protein